MRIKGSNVSVQFVHFARRTLPWPCGTQATQFQTQRGVPLPHPIGFNLFIGIKNV